MRYYPLSQGPEMIRLYRAISSNQVYDYTRGMDDLSVYSNDILMFCLQNPYGLRPALVSKPLRCQGVTGRPAYAASTPVEIDTRTERPKKLEWSWQADYAHYGSMLMLNSQLSQQSPTEHFREHGVSHPNFVGELTDSDASFEYLFNRVPGAITWLSGSSDRFDLIPGLAGPLSELIHFGNHPSGWPNYYGYYDQDGSGAYLISADAYDLTNSILHAGLHDGHMSTSFGNGDLAEYSDFSGEFFRDGNHYQADFSYTFVKRRPNPTKDYTSSFRVRIRFFAEFREVHHNVDDTVWVNIHPDVFQWSDNCSVSLLGSDGPSGSYPQDVGDGYKLSFPYGTQLFTQPLHQEVKPGQTNFETLRSLGTQHPWELFALLKERVEPRVRFLRPSSFISSSDALDKQMTAFSGNLLQNLQHVKGLLDLIPDPAPLERLIAKAMKGDPSAIKDLFDLLSEYILKYRFEIAPLLRDVQKLTELDLSQVEQASKVQELTGYGVFRYTFSDSENFMPGGILTLETRSKVRFISDPSTLFGQLLMANSVGLLPNLSRIWNLLPFSFVVDWFTNMSKRLHLVDDQVLYLALRVVFCVHSYKVVWYPSSDFLSPYNVTNSDPTKPFGVSMYIREFTRITPRLVDSPYDFLRPTSSPDPVTVGALLWQILA